MIKQFAYKGEISDQAVKLELGFIATHLDVFNDGAADLTFCFCGDDTSRCRVCSGFWVLGGGFTLKKGEHHSYGLAPGTMFVCARCEPGKTTSARFEAYHF